MKTERYLILITKVFLAILLFMIIIFAFLATTREKPKKENSRTEKEMLYAIQKRNPRALCNYELIDCFEYPLHNIYYGQITSFYGSWRPWGKDKAHRGIDLIGNPEVFAAASGIVIDCAYDIDYGNMVTIMHQNHITRYAHLKYIWCKKGDPVTTKTCIGYKGSSGRYAFKKTHLHFEILELRKVKGKDIYFSIDPLGINKYSFYQWSE